jgi:tRNA(adenine34) deaminase
MRSDDYYIKCCVELGRLACRNGESAVGALIVFQGEVISEASEAVKSKKDVTCHAEIEAIRAALRNRNLNTLEGAVMYSSHEPCVMCSYVIRYYKISKVVFQHFVPYLGGISSSLKMLSSKDVPSTWGVSPKVIRHS